MKITKNIIIYIKLFLNKMSEDAVSAYSAYATFFIMISFFPFVMLLLTLLNYIPITNYEASILNINIMPDLVSSFVFKTIEEINSKVSGTIISITAITSIWSASTGMLALIKGLHSVYKIKEHRNYIKLRIVASLYTLVFIAVLIVTLLILAFGNSVYLGIKLMLPSFLDVALAIISVRTISAFFILTIFFLFIYKMVPRRKTKIFNELPGALIAALGWMGFSYLYSYYIDNVSNYTIYGSLTAVVLLMLWLYFCMYILLFGAEVNVVIQTDENILNWRKKHRFRKKKL